MITEQNIQDIQYLLDIAFDSEIITPYDDKVIKRTQQFLDESCEELKGDPL